MNTVSRFPRPWVAGLDRSLLSGEALLSAIRGHHVGDHQLAQLACELGGLHHRRLLGRDSECCRRRTELVSAVDVWMGAHLPIPHPDARVHTETLGAVIDRMAETQVRAYHLLMTVDPSDPQVHADWYRLAELVDSYTDLVTGLSHRAIRLPALGDHR